MQIHNLKRKTENRKVGLVGRGGKRGKTSGRGTKGQRARAGRKIRPEIRDLIKRVPKLRGYDFKTPRPINKIIINIGDLDKIVASGEKVNPQALLQKGIIETRGGKMPVVKILGGGEISKKIEISNCFVSKEAKAKVEKAGGLIK